MELMPLLIAIGSFAGGLISNVIASYLYDMRHLLYGHRLALAGNWAEFVPNSVGRQFSHGTIYFDRSQKIYRFDGTNYSNDGVPYCYWQTVASYVDRERRQFFYVFSATVVDELDKTYYGFGVVNLEIEGKMLVPSDGHYVSSNVDPVSMSHTMQVTPYLPYRKGATGKEMIKIVIKNMPGNRNNS